ncbi:MAG: OmpH family outer membrane protein [Xanthomonadales bacterium]|nr:OmpH family outer membrane protein [Xanthomonadales bacterium]
MRTVHIIALLCFLAITIPVMAQENRIAYVDMKAVLDQAPQVIAGRQRLDQEFRARNDALAQDEQRLQTLQAQLEANQLLPPAQALSAPERRRTEQEIRLLERSIQRRRDELRQELQLRRNEEISRVEVEINQAIAAIASQKGYDLVLASPVVYASDRIDVTDLILQHLQQEHAADQAEQEQP